MFLAYRNVEALDALIDKWVNTKTAVYNFTAEDGIEHAVWIVNDTASIEKITGILMTKFHALILLMAITVQHLLLK